MAERKTAAMGAKNIRISITSALNAAGIEATKQQVDEMGRSLSKSMANASAANKRHWADIKAAWDMGCSAIRKAWQFASAGLKSAFHFETQTTQFKTLIGNIDEARAHMADLKALGDTPPFSLDEFAKASRSLMVMTDGALGYKKSLEMIGDAAAATGYPIEELGQAVGRMYAFIRDGQPLSRAVMQLRNMGVITPEVAQKLQDLQAAGKSNAEIWAEVETQLGRYKGAMAETEKTGEGLFAAMKTRWENIVRQFGTALMDEAKEGLETVNDAAKDLEESGFVEVWANKTIDKLKEVKTAFSAIGEAVTWLWEKTGASDLYRVGTANIGAAAYTVTRSVAGLANGEGFDALKNAMAEGAEVRNKELAKGYYMKQLSESGWLGKGMKKAAQDNIAEAEYEARQEEEIRNKAAKKREAREKVESNKKAERERKERERIQANLEEAQRKRESLNAVENFDKYKASGSSLSYKEWLKEETKKKAEAEEESKRQYADFLKKTGIDMNADAKNISSTDSAFMKFKSEQERKKEDKIKADEEAARKAAETQMRLDREAAAMRERLAQKELDQKIRAHQKLLAAEQKAESEAHRRKQTAESKLQQAWGWYRDKESMRAQMEEEKADKAARKQFEKDFEKLKSKRRDWRTAENLSVDEEAVRRVGLAREEKERADKHLAEIEKNTAGLAKKLDELISMK